MRILFYDNLTIKTAFIKYLFILVSDNKGIGDQAIRKSRRTVMLFNFGRDGITLLGHVSWFLPLGRRRARCVAFSGKTAPGELRLG